MDKEVKIRFGTEGVEKTADGFEKVDNSNKELRDSLMKTSVAFTALAAAGVAAMYQLIQASDAQEQAMRKLSAALDQTGQNTEEMTQKVVRFATNMQQLTGVGDEELIPMISRLAMEFGNVDDALAVIPGLMAAAEIKGVSLSTVVRGVESALHGQSGALSRYGITIEDTSSKQGILNGILENTNKFLPQLGINTETLAGKLRVITLNFGDLMEPLGKALSDIFLPLAEWLRDMTVRIGPLVEALAPMIAKLLLVGTILSVIIAGISSLALGLMYLPKILVIIKAAMLPLLGIVGAALGPVGWIVLGIGAIAATVWTFWGQIKSLFNFIISGATAVWGFLKNIPIIGWAFEGIELIAGKIGELWNWITSTAQPVFMAIADWAMKAANIMYTVFAAAWNMIARNINAGIQQYNAAAAYMGLSPTSFYMPVMPSTAAGLGRLAGGAGGGGGVASFGGGGGTLEGMSAEMPDITGSGISSGGYQGMTATAGTPAGAVIPAGTTTRGIITRQTSVGDYNTVLRSNASPEIKEKILRLMDKESGINYNIVIHNQGSVISENNLIENIKKGLKSGQSGDSFSF